MRTKQEQPKPHDRQRKRPEKQPHREPRHEPHECGPACETIATCRNRYYTGRYLTAHDFSLEQGYFLSRHRLHNRLLHGWGIVCGLEVGPHEHPNCPNHVVVQPGIAIDCCGREIVLEEPQVVVVWDRDNPPPYGVTGGKAQAGDEDDHEEYGEYDEQEQSYEGQGDETPQDVKQEQAYEKPEPRPEPEPEEPRQEDSPAYLLYICYCEQETELAPALYDDGKCGGEVCGSDRLEANRICERVTLHVIEWNEANRRRYAGCWTGEEPQPQPCRDDCAGRPDTVKSGCLAPECDCDLCVPLALIRPTYGERGYAIEKGSLDRSGRRELQTPAGYLTHIVDLNWPHGGSVSLSDLRDNMNGELRVTFDRKLQQQDPEAENSGTGINESTFMVEVHRKADVQYPVEVLHNDGTPPRLDEARCTAIFTIDDELLEGYQNLSGSLLHVTLRCDFILDCHGRPVDGNHLRGALQSGDGRAGGTFESWFWVTDEERPRRRRRRQRQEEAS